MHVHFLLDNLNCPVCFAESGTHVSGERSLADIEIMLDTLVASEAEPDLVQISGGEPTIHPQFFEILDACKRRPIRHLMINANGVKIAKDAKFAERLATYMPGFEVYLQFDSLERDALMNLRGADLRSVRTHFIEPGGKIYPFDTFNLFYRDKTVVEKLRKGVARVR